MFPHCEEGENPPAPYTNDLGISHKYVHYTRHKLCQPHFAGIHILTKSNLFIWTNQHEIIHKYM